MPQNPMNPQSLTEQTKLTSYFKNRGVDPTHYFSFQLPTWLQDELPLDKTSRILDIGCGFGQMLLRMRDAGYTNLQGIDIGHESVEFCSSLGLNVNLISSIPEFSKQNEAIFDLILMSHVLEHIPHHLIIETLVSIRKMLSPRGHFVVMVPNAQSATGVYWMYEDFTHHLLFTAGSLKYVLLAAGFSKIEFLDPRCLKGLTPTAKFKRKVLLRLYEMRTRFWNRATASSFHDPSPRIYSFEVKAKAGQA